MASNKHKTIEDTIDKASAHLRTAEEHLKSRVHYSEAVEAAQECVELSVKSILSLLGVAFSPSHEWKPDKEQFAKIAKQIQERHLLDKLEGQSLSYVVNLPRLLMLMNFWGQFYLISKYGFETGDLASAKKLFKQEEAELAVQHAGECLRAASKLRYLDAEKMAELLS